ncbi:MAG: hypothetical protein QOE31_2244 [Solirubrobacteraceae bacterium]|jgi:hypothetical protein|nr:hypothetical protein [Solirubrobacteraceae bacterium]
MPSPLTAARINPNRTVAVLTPLLFAPAAGSISALAAKYGLDIDGGSLQAIFIAGSTIAFAKAAQWTKGWQEFEKRQDAHQTDAALIGAADFDDFDDAEDDADEIDAVATQQAQPDLDFDDLDEDFADDLDAEAEALFAGHGS